MRTHSALLLCTFLVAFETIGQTVIPLKPNPQKAQTRTVSVPYWTERDSHHSTLHVRNSDHHHTISGRLRVYSESGALLRSQMLSIDPLTTTDFQLADFTTPGSPNSLLAGTLLFDYVSAYDAQVQAEISIRDDKRNHAYTIVGRPTLPSKRPYYLVYNRPKSTTYLEYAVANPTDKVIAFQVEIKKGEKWEALGAFTVSPNGVQKSRIEGAELTASESNSADLSGLVRITMSSPESSSVLGAWLEDESTGYSNTVLFHDVWPNTNSLYAAQAVVGEFPRSALNNGPAFSGNIVFANIGTDASSVSIRASCDKEGSVVDLQPMTLVVESQSHITIDLEKLLRDKSPSAISAVCNIQATYTGPPGFVFGRYFGASRNQTYGLYVRMEPALGRGYSEVYWTAEEDFVPLLTVANFRDKKDIIDVYLTQEGQLQLLSTLDLESGTSSTLNLRSLIEKVGVQSAIKRKGGIWIWSRSAEGRIVVKQHSFSKLRLMMSPYYGSYSYIDSVLFDTYPSLTANGSQAWATTSTCYVPGGCYSNQAYVGSTVTSVMTVTNFVAPYNWARLSAVSNGQTNLVASQTGIIDTQGNTGTVVAAPVQTKVSSCGDINKDGLYDEYRDPTYNTPYRPSCSDFVTNISTTNFTFNELNTSNTYTYGIFTGGLTTGVECVRTNNGNVALTINSAFRGPAKNASIGGAADSMHIHGNAVDFSAPAGNVLRTNADTIKTACGACREPLNLTSTWVHFDWRGTCPAGW